MYLTQAASWTEWCKISWCKCGGMQTVYMLSASKLHYLKQLMITPKNILWCQILVPRDMMSRSTTAVVYFYTLYGAGTSVDIMYAMGLVCAENR